MIYLDVDGVLADWWGHFATTHNVVSASRPRTRTKAKSYCSEEAMRTLSAEWWANIPPTPEADIVVGMCNKFDQVTICTSVYWPEAIRGRMLWFKEHPRLLGNTGNVFCLKNKSFFLEQDDILIDDTSENGPNILFPSHDNEHREVQDKVSYLWRELSQHYAL